tara:strand:- start:435 stop:875 length:441 start_codon:yes stop_codon:yes gene_type:complete
MGTRSLTVFNDTYENEEICVLYRQYDGYPEGHGTDLLNFLKDMKVVNGINSENEKWKISNGMDCLAAQIVSHFKSGPGYFYINRADTRDVGEEFIYTLYYKNNDLHIKVEDTYENDDIKQPDGHLLFDGIIDEYEQWILSKNKKLS